MTSEGKPLGGIRAHAQSLKSPPSKEANKLAILDILFWAMATISIVAALAVIHVRDLFRAALFLVVSFVAVAGLFVMLSAEFLAAVQVLIYAGAIPILIIFAIMLSPNVQQGNTYNRLMLPALIVASGVLAVLIFAIVKTKWNLLEYAHLSLATRLKVEEVFADTTSSIGDLLLRNWVLPFEMASILLLAALIGALVLVRER